jgi:tetratricopeptide (TPR) repeat protein
MATRQSTEHNIRPRVLAAVLRLQRFTVQEVVSAANLENRKQAYAQLQFLAKQGYISGAAMAAEQPNRPPTLYRIEPEKIAEIAKKVAGYGVLPVETSLRARDAAIARAREILTEVEGRLSAMKPVALNRTQLEQTSTLLEKVAKQLEEVDIELDTAKMESAEQGEGDREISQTALRLDESRNTIRGLEKALRIRHSVNWITNVVKDWTKKKPNTIEQARKLLQRSEGRLATEIVLDLLSPGFHNHELMPAILASQAIRTNDLDLISLCLMRLSKETSAWWRYNLLNTEFLQGRFEEAYEKWRDIYVEVARNTHCALDKERALGIFIYEPKEMKLDRLLPLFKKYEVSIVSPHTLGFGP